MKLDDKIQNGGIHKNGFIEKAVRYNSLYRQFSKGRQAAYEEQERERQLYYATITI